MGMWKSDGDDDLLSFAVVLIYPDMVTSKDISTRFWRGVAFTDPFLYPVK